MKCTMCGYQFEEKSAQTACKSCPLNKGCGMVCCPNCGFEVPLEPKWLRKLADLLKGRKHAVDGKR